MGFTGIDYLVLFAYLIIITLWGWWFGKKQRNTRDYFLGGREVPWWAICLSIVATETSALTFIGVPSLAYQSNISFLQFTFGYVIARFIIGFLFIRAYYMADVYTAYGYLRERFGPQAKNSAAIIFFITRVLASGVRLYAASIVLAVVTGMSELSAILLIGVIAVIYTSLGGIKAVIWTDVLQMFLMIAGGTMALVRILSLLPGGWSDVVAAAQPQAKFHLLNLSLDFKQSYTLWSGLIGGTFLGMASHGTDQSLVQRLLTNRKPEGSMKALILSGFIVVPQFLLFLIIGVMLYAFYQHYPLPVPLENPDQIFPFFIVNQLAAGISGLIIASIFAASMSSLDSALNALASTSVVDFYKPYIKSNSSDRHYLMISRGFTLLWGAILVGLAFLAKGWGSVLEVGLKVASFTYGALLGVFLLGMLTQASSERGTTWSMLAGIATVLLVSRFTAIAWSWYVFLGSLVTFLMGYLFSRLNN